MVCYSYTWQINQSPLESNEKIPSELLLLRNPLWGGTVSANEIVQLSHWLSRAVPFPDSYSNINARPGQSSISPTCALPPGHHWISSQRRPLLCPACTRTHGSGQEGSLCQGSSSTAHRAQAAPQKPTFGSLWCASPHLEPTGASPGLSKILVMNKRNKNPKQHRAEPAQPRSCSVPTTHNPPLLTYKALQPRQCWHPSSKPRGLVKPIKMSLKTAFKKLPGQGQLLNKHTLLPWAKEET